MVDSKLVPLVLMLLTQKISHETWEMIKRHHGRERQESYNLQQTMNTRGARHGAISGLCMGLHDAGEASDWSPDTILPSDWLLDTAIDSLYDHDAMHCIETWSRNK